MNIVLALVTWQLTVNQVFGLVKLRQSDFNEGTYIIDTPDTYMLMEDIVFRPNGDLDAAEPESFMYPTDAQLATKYNSFAYSLGFFAAISIAVDDVVLDLNGFELKQSEEHSLMQRFFALIELGSAPFPPNTGPANFGLASVFPNVSSWVSCNKYKRY